MSHQPRGPRKNPSLKGLRRFSIPTGVYTQHTGRLTRELMKIYRSVRAGRTTKAEAITRGNKVLEDTRAAMMATAQKWFRKNNVEPVEPETRFELDGFLDEKKKEWANIVSDM